MINDEAKMAVAALLNKLAEDVAELDQKYKLDGLCVHCCPDNTWAAVEGQATAGGEWRRRPPTGYVIVYSLC